MGEPRSRPGTLIAATARLIQSAARPSNISAYASAIFPRTPGVPARAACSNSSAAPS
ncbi:hypothetical protein [Streptomyces sp. TE33382]